MTSNDDAAQLGPRVGAARNAARKLLKDAGATGVPVDLGKIAGHLNSRHGLKVVRFQLGEKVSGLLVVNADGLPTVGVNAGQALVRQRLTAAHEIGHFLLGHECAGECGHGDAEVEAFQFAAELLMPLASLRGDFRNTPDLDALARRYVVSKEALCRHLMECRIL